jgi:hypothetical protein
MTRSPSLIAQVLLAGLTLGLTARPVLAADLPQYPNEQQALLRDTEHQVLDVQLQLFAARQRNDQAAVEQLGKQFKELQDKRRALIDATRDQLPSQ